MFGTPLWSGVKTQKGLSSGDKKSPAGFGDALTFPRAPSQTSHLWFCRKILSTTVGWVMITFVSVISCFPQDDL